MKVEVQKQEYIFRSRWLTVRKDDLLTDNQQVIEGYYVVEGSDIVMVVAINHKNEVIIKSEYRYPVNQVLTEIPGGMFTLEKELPLDAAKRELKEETGCESIEWELLGRTYCNPARQTSTTYLYLAKNCVQSSEQNLDESEEILSLKSEWVPFKDAINMVLANEINVNNSANALLRCAILYPELLG